MTDVEEEHPLRGEEDYVNLDTEQAKAASFHAVQFLSTNSS